MSRDLFEIAPVGLLLTDAAGTILRSNDAAARLLGLPAEDLAGRTLADLGRRLGYGLGAGRHARLAGRVIEAEIKGDGPDAEARVVTLEISDLPASPGEAGGYIVAVRDETPLARSGVGRDARTGQARRRRRQDEQIANAAFEASPIGIQVFDAEGTSVRMNAAQRRLLGLRDRDHGPGAFNVLRDPLSFATGEAGAFARAYEGETIENFEYDVDLGAPHNLWSNRSDKPSFARTIFPIRDDDGSIAGVVSFLQEITERRALERQLAFLAYHDSLTHLANRSLFSDRLALALKARRPGLVAVACLDLDGFKWVNDRHGHAAGDELLRSVAGSLRSALREGDLAARLGGDEFAVLLDDLPSPEAARQVVERLFAQIARPVTIGGAVITPSASVGLVLATRQVDPERVAHEADATMYAAKAAGKGRISQRARTLRPTGTASGKAAARRRPAEPDAA